LLVQSGKAANPCLIPIARAVNDSMPYHMLDLVSEASKAAGRALDQSVVAVMGASFLQDSGDPRNSPSVPVIESLRRVKQLRVHDPHLDEIAGIKTTKDVRKALSGADIAVFMVAHKEYQRLTASTLKRLMRSAVVVDGRNIFSPEKMHKAGVVYRGIGKRIIR